MTAPGRAGGLLSSGCLPPVSGQSCRAPCSPRGGAPWGLADRPVRHLLRFGRIRQDLHADHAAGGYEYRVGWRPPTLAAVLWVVALGMWAAVMLPDRPAARGARSAGSVLTLLAGVVTALYPVVP